MIHEGHDFSYAIGRILWIQGWRSEKFCGYYERKLA